MESAGCWAWRLGERCWAWRLGRLGWKLTGGCWRLGWRVEAEGRKSHVVSWCSQHPMHLLQCFTSTYQVMARSSYVPRVGAPRRCAVVLAASSRRRRRVVVAESSPPRRCVASSQPRRRRLVVSASSPGRRQVVVVVGSRRRVVVASSSPGRHRSSRSQGKAPTWPACKLQKGHLVRRLVREKAQLSSQGSPRHHQPSSPSQGTMR